MIESCMIERNFEYILIICLTLASMGVGYFLGLVRKDTLHEKGDVQNE